MDYMDNKKSGDHRSGCVMHLRKRKKRRNFVFVFASLSLVGNSGRLTRVTNKFTNIDYMDNKKNNNHRSFCVIKTLSLCLCLSVCPPPWGRLLAPGMFKPSCSTPFTLFLRLVCIYRPFQLYFIPKTLSKIPPFSAPFL